MKKRTLIGIWGVVASFSLGVSAFGQAEKKIAQRFPPVTLHVGDDAPQIKVIQWPKGAPFTSFEKGKVYVVEFWATWCNWCIAGMPHLTEVAKKFAGRVVVTSVDVKEHPNHGQTSVLPQVDDFVKSHDSVMGYNVAVDGADHYMDKSWLSAAGEHGIPCAFIVDQQGKIAWIAHPTYGLGYPKPESTMEEALGQLLAGTYDAKAFAAKRDAKKAADNAEITVLGKATGLNEKKDYKGAIELCDDFAKDHPGQEMSLLSVEYPALLHIDESRAYDFISKALANSGQDSETLNMISYEILNTPGASARCYQVGFDAAKKAMPRDPSIEKRADLEYVLAVGYSRLGDYHSAVEHQKKALDLSERDKGLNPADYQGELAIYQAEDSVGKGPAKVEAMRLQMVADAALKACVQTRKAGKKEMASHMVRQVAEQFPDVTSQTDALLFDWLSQDNPDEWRGQAMKMATSKDPQEMRELLGFAVKQAAHPGGNVQLGASAIELALKATTETDLRVLESAFTFYSLTKDSKKALDMANRILAALPNSDQKDNAELKAQIEQAKAKLEADARSPHF